MSVEVFFILAFAYTVMTAFKSRTSTECACFENPETFTVANKQPGIWVETLRGQDVLMTGYFCPMKNFGQSIQVMEHGATWKLSIFTLLCSENCYLFDKCPQGPQKSNDIHKSKQEAIKTKSSAFNKQGLPSGSSFGDITGACGRGVYECTILLSSGFLPSGYIYWIRTEQTNRNLHKIIYQKGNTLTAQNAVAKWMGRKMQR